MRSHFAPWDVHADAVALAGLGDAPDPHGENAVTGLAQLEDPPRHVQNVELAVGAHSVNRAALQGTQQARALGVCGVRVTHHAALPCAPQAGK